MWGYFGYELLFAIPLVGFIVLLVFAFGGTRNKNLKNFARSYFCAMIVAVIIIVILAFVLGGLGYAIGSSSPRYYWQLVLTSEYNDVRVKRHFAPNLISTNCFAAKLLLQFLNIRNSLIYYVNRYFLMFGGAQGQKSYHANINNFSTLDSDII